MTLRNYSNSSTTGTLAAPVAGSDNVMLYTGLTNPPAVPFTITVDRNSAAEEVCLVTANVGSALTVTRGFDGTSQTTHAAGASIEHTAGAIEFREANAHVNASTGVHGASGALVDTTSSQTLTGKTMTSPLCQADPVYGDALVVYTPSNASGKNLISGMNASGATVFTVDSTGALVSPTMKDASGAVNFKWRQMTAAAYAALATKDPATLYVIVG